MNPALVYEITIQTRDWDLAQKWCEKFVGEFNEDWYKLGIDPMLSVLEDDHSTTWYFKKSHDAAWFALRWS
jgi:hypothetical protein